MKVWAVLFKENSPIGPILGIHGNFWTKEAAEEAAASGNNEGDFFHYYVQETTIMA